MRCLSTEEEEFQARDGEGEHFSWILVLNRIFNHSALPRLLSSPGVVDGTPVQSSGRTILPRLPFDATLEVGLCQTYFHFCYLW